MVSCYTYSNLAVGSILALDKFYFSKLSKQSYFLIWSVLVSPGNSWVSSDQSWSVQVLRIPGNLAGIAQFNQESSQNLYGIYSQLAKTRFLEDPWRIPGLPGGFLVFLEDFWSSW